MFGIVDAGIPSSFMCRVQLLTSIEPRIPMLNDIILPVQPLPSSRMRESTTGVYLLTLYLSDAIRLVGLESKHLVYSRKQSFFFFQFIAMPSGRLRSSEHSGMELLRRSSRAVLLCSNSSSSISSSSVGSSSVVANHSGSS